MGLLSNLGFMLALLALGVGARYVGLLTPPRRDRLNQLAFYLALPAVVFTSTYTVSLGDVVSVPLVVGLIVVLLGVAGVAWVVHRAITAPPARRVAVVQSYHCNFGYLGVPVVALTFGAGSLVTAKASLLLGIGALVQSFVTVSILVSGGSAAVSYRNQAKGIATNPVIIALVVGLTFARFGVGVPGPALAVLNVLSELALPAALLGVGASLIVDFGDVDVPSVAAVVGIKTVGMPLAAFGVFSVLGATATTLTAGVVMTAMPTAVSTYLYASELGGDAEFASLNVFLTTFASLGTLFVVLSLFG